MHTCREEDSRPERKMWPDYCNEKSLNAHLHTLMCCADERDRVQKKTFTKWVNKHLIKVRKHITDLYEDLRDGHNLISLLEVLSGVTLRKGVSTMRRVCVSRAPPLILTGGEEEDGDQGSHMLLMTLLPPALPPLQSSLPDTLLQPGSLHFPPLAKILTWEWLQNVQIALDFLKQRQVKLVNIRNDDITDGNPKLTLGLIWTIILHFQTAIPGQVPQKATALQKSSVKEHGGILDCLCLSEVAVACWEAGTFRVGFLKNGTAIPCLGRVVGFWAIGSRLCGDLAASV
ncbi:hypothetical protein AALO_G00255530 [Alosa alosa]|uniref:Calponin-homology (CH) domain-containing protein n=1 Tax=Alosa alosa TaxID=278164 RepID=A0AAV6FNT7_9TELE|nr:hypothetical protein AALO_G00255530 [Alosa alosa]